MIATVILVASAAALAEFFVAYCRSLIASTNDYVLSDHGRKLAGATGNQMAPERFAPVAQLVKLCPRLAGRSEGMGAVTAYFGLMSAVAEVSHTLGLGLSNWADRERAGCAFFAAVALDRRIARNRELLAAEISTPS